MTSASVPPSAPATGANPSRRRRWPTFVAIGAVALLVGATVGYFAGAPARNDLQSQRDDALAQVDSLSQQLDTAESDLATTQADLATATSDLATTQGQLTAAQSDVASLTQERDQLAGSLSTAALAAKASAYFEMNLSPAYLDRLTQGGADLAKYDALLASLGESSTASEWVTGPLSFWALDQAVITTGDAQLIDAWNTWVAAEVGSIAEEVAIHSFIVRINQMLVDATANAG